MRVFNIHCAKTHLSRLVDEAAQGFAFFVAKAGKPMVKVTPVEKEHSPATARLGIMEGQISVPDDFDQMGVPEVVEIFEGKSS